MVVLGFGVVVLLVVFVVLGFGVVLGFVLVGVGCLVG